MKAQVKRICFLGFLLLITSAYTYSQRNKYLKKFKGEDRESFQYGVMEAVDMSQHYRKFKYIYNSTDQSNSYDEILDTLMARYEILYIPYVISFCSTDDDEAFDAGYEFATDSMIKAEHGKHFIDSLLKVAQVERKRMVLQNLDTMEQMDSIDCKYCDKNIFNYGQYRYSNDNRVLFPLKNLDSDSNGFEFLENCVNSFDMEFTVHIGFDGKVTLVDSFAIQQYDRNKVNNRDHTEIIQFVSQSLIDNVPYPVCMYRKKPKKYVIRQFVCFRYIN